MALAGIEPKSISERKKEESVKDMRKSIRLYLSNTFHLSVFHRSSIQLPMRRPHLYINRFSLPLHAYDTRTDRRMDGNYSQMAIEALPIVR